MSGVASLARGWRFPATARLALVLLSATVLALIPASQTARADNPGANPSTKDSAARPPVAAPERPAPAYPLVQPGRPLAFPADHGAHPAYRIEWWYLTGWVEDETIAPGAAGASPHGFQITFFRLRPGVQETNPSAFAPRQLLFAHAAIADPALGRLRHAERSARAGFGLAGASEDDTRVAIGDWSLVREADAAGERYRARAAGDGFAFELLAVTDRPPLLQGEAGYSRKGPQSRNASYYYSRPQLAVEGRLSIDGQERKVRGRAWLDHEWSSEAMPAGAVGWDWLGANLDDGGALMAFRLRDAAGATLWSAATVVPAIALPAAALPPIGVSASPVAASGTTRRYGPGEVDFRPLRRWRSPRTGGDYAVETEIRVGARRYRVRPLLDDQELDARGSVGAVYWEGAVRLLDADGAAIGRGYLEITGALSRLRL